MIEDEDEVFWICRLIINLLFVSIVCLEGWKLVKNLELYDPEHNTITETISGQEMVKIIQNNQDGILH